VPTRALSAPADLGAELLTVVARLNRMATQHSALAMPYAQARLLAQIEQQGPSRISELAAADHCSQPTMTAQVQRLEAGGWARRRPDPSDARAVLVSVTPAGSRALAQARADRAAVVVPHLERLDPAQRETLAEAVGILRGILTEVATHTPSASAPRSRTTTEQE
jgi:DNA-binding MarR family transcriptional regulator